MITIDDLAKVEIRVGTILEAEDVAGSEKLIKTIVDFGDPSTGSGLGRRQILSGIKQWYKPESLVGKQFVYVVNLESRMMMGLESQGMLLAAEGEIKPMPLKPAGKVPAGAKIR
jgi:methionine--tRNA ligase beta chain